MTWKEYSYSVLLLSLVSFVAVYGFQRFQGVLPLNPDNLPAVSPDSAFNTAVSFTTNTNWQGYGGESTMSYLTQMLALTVQNFASAAVGMAVLVALTVFLFLHDWRGTVIACVAIPTSIVSTFVLMRAMDREEIDVAYAGDICALVGIKDVITGDTPRLIDASSRLGSI